MPVEIIVDHWNPEKRRYRTETFCYGPLSCSAYKPGPAPKVPGRNGMAHEEPDWVVKMPLHTEDLTTEFSNSPGTRSTVPAINFGGGLGAVRVRGEAMERATAKLVTS